MAEETPQERRQDADETPPIVVPSHDPLPPPPDVSYTRPTPRATPPPALRPFGDVPGRGPEEDRGAYVSKLGAGLAAATTFVASVVAGFLIGQWIDHRWGHAGGTPWGTLVFSLLGVAAGFLNLFRVLAATDRGPKKR